MPTYRNIRVTPEAHEGLQRAAERMKWRSPTRTRPTFSQALDLVVAEWLASNPAKGCEDPVRTPADRVTSPGPHPVEAEAEAARAKEVARREADEDFERKLAEDDMSWLADPEDD